MTTLFPARHRNYEIYARTSRESRYLDLDPALEMAQFEQRYPPPKAAIDAM